MLLNIRVLPPFIDDGREHGKNEVVKSFRDRETFIRFPATNPFPSLTTAFCHLKLRSSRANGKRISLVFFLFCGPILSDPDSHSRRNIISDVDKLGINRLPLIANSRLSPRERKVLAKGKHKRARRILGCLFSEGGFHLKVATRVGIISSGWEPTRLFSQRYPLICC